MLGRVNDRQIAKLKVCIWQKMLSEWIEFSHKDTIYKLKFGWLKFSEAQRIPQIKQTYPLPNISAIWHEHSIIIIITGLVMTTKLKFLGVSKRRPNCLLCTATKINVYPRVPTLAET